MSDNSFVLDGITWSFSSINSYYQCPQMFKMSYIDCLDKSSSAFAEFGTLCHDLFERYYKGEKEFYELSQCYEDKYNDVVKHRFPPNAYVNLNESYYEKGKNYFENFEGDFEGFQVLGVEKRFVIKIGEYKFTVIIDLILKNDDGIVIVDHKSKAKFKSKKEKQEYLRQLYLYSIYIKKKYKEYPKKLIFNMFRAEDKVEEVFDIKAFEEAKEWCVNTIEKIYKDIEFDTNQDNFFCNWLCGVRHHCVCSDKYLGEG